MKTPNQTPPPHNSSNETRDKLKNSDATHIGEVMETNLDEILAKPQKIIDRLMFGSYCANREQGMSKESYQRMMCWTDERANEFEEAYQKEINQ